MKETWSYDRRGGGHVKCLVTKKRSADGKYLNILFASAVAKAKAMKTNKKSKSKDTSELEDDNNSEHFILKKPQYRRGRRPWAMTNPQGAAKSTQIVRETHLFP